MIKTGEHDTPQRFHVLGFLRMPHPTDSKCVLAAACTLVLLSAGCVWRHTISEGAPVCSPDAQVEARMHFYEWYVGLFYIPWLGGYTPEAELTWRQTGSLLPHSLMLRGCELDDAVPLAQDYLRLVYSPDGRYLALVMPRDVWIVDLKNGRKWDLEDRRTLVSSFIWQGPDRVAYVTMAKEGDDFSGTRSGYSPQAKCLMKFWRVRIQRQPTREEVLSIPDAPIPASIDQLGTFPEEAPSFLWLEDGSIVDAATRRQVLPRRDGEAGN